MVHAFMTVDCPKCGAAYCVVCKEVCPSCGAVPTISDQMRLTRDQMRRHMDRKNVPH